MEGKEKGADQVGKEEGAAEAESLRGRRVRKHFPGSGWYLGTVEGRGADGGYLVLFDDALRHLLRINRLTEMPRGSGLAKFTVSPDSCATCRRSWWQPMRPAARSARPVARRLARRPG